MSEPRHLHLIGVCGSGMLPLALLLRQGGYTVSGSEAKIPPERLALLRDAGVEIRAQTNQARSQRTGGVVISPAIPLSHPERRAARREGLAERTRAQALADLLSGRPAVCMAGSHGKSTTTAMLVHILRLTGNRDFGHMLGAFFADGALPPARLGAADAPFVTEACEAHGALDAWRPTHAVLTNLDDDHADHYGGVAGLRRAFGEFLARVPQSGCIVGAATTQRRSPPRGPRAARY